VVESWLTAVKLGIFGLDYYAMIDFPISLRGDGKSHNFTAMALA